LKLDATPVYAVMPAGAFGNTAYERLREWLNGQLHSGVELVSVPGILSGQVTLLSGQVVPILVPAVRGMYSWTTRALIASVLGARPKTATKEQKEYDERAGGLNDFLNRVYYDLRNLGITAQERALNYSATNAFQVAQVVESTTRDELDLNTITVKKSPICRPDSDCYDVELSFFNPNNTRVADKIYRFTVDVSDVIPVTIGEVRSWTKRA
jgi:cyanobactin maturation PatA/PatG family protease